MTTDHTPPTTQQLDEYEAAARNAARIGSGIDPAAVLELAAEVRRLRATQPVALPARWACANGPSDDEPFCAAAEADAHVCPTIRVHPDDAEAFAALVAAANAESALARVRTVLETEAVVGRSALEYRGLVSSALMAAAVVPAVVETGEADA